MIGCSIPTLAIWAVLLKESVASSPGASEFELLEDEEVNLITMKTSLKIAHAAELDADQTLSGTKGICKSILEGDENIWEEQDDVNGIPTSKAHSTHLQLSEHAQVKSVGSNDQARNRLSREGILALEFLICLAFFQLFRVCFGNDKFGTSGVESAETCEVNPIAQQAHASDHLNKVDIWGCTALHEAAKAGSVEKVRSLCEHGCRIDPIDAWDETPLHLAAREGHVEVVAELLMNGAAIDPINAQDWTPLVVAADAGQEAMCSFLLDRKAGCADLLEDDHPPLLRALLQEQAERIAIAAEQNSFTS